jgi:hypothetical protein
MIMTSFSTFLIVLVSLSYSVVINAQNIAQTTFGVTVVASGGALFSRQLPDGVDTEADLPTGVSGFDDVSIDAIGENIVIGLSTASQVVCSYLLDRSSATLTLVNCAGNNEISVMPFSGLSALGGTIVVSGGTGGVSIFKYDGTTGEISENPSLANYKLPRVTGGPNEVVIGVPNVVLISPILVAFSSDIGGTPRFGTIVASIDEAGENLKVEREYLLDGLEFENALKPSNFAFVSAVRVTFDATYLFTANGVLSVVNPMIKEEEYYVLNDNDNDNEIPEGFQAVTVAVNPLGNRAFFGGVIAGEENSMFLEYDITNPSVPKFVRKTEVIGRITSIAPSDDFISVATTKGGNGMTNEDAIQFFPANEMKAEVPATTETKNRSKGKGKGKGSLSRSSTKSN